MANQLFLKCEHKEAVLGSKMAVRGEIASVIESKWLKMAVRGEIDAVIETKWLKIAVQGETAAATETNE